MREEDQESQSVVISYLIHLSLVVIVKYSARPRSAINFLLRSSLRANSQGRAIVKMLILFETSLGVTLFKLKDGKMTDPNLFKEFEDSESASSL